MRPSSFQGGWWVCKPSHLGGTTHASVFSLIGPSISSFAEKNLGVLVDTNLNMSQKCDFGTKNINGVLGCIRRIVASRSRKVILSLHSAVVESCGQLWLHLESCGQF